MYDKLRKLDKQVFELNKKKKFEEAFEILNNALAVADSEDEKYFILRSIAGEYHLHSTETEYRLQSNYKYNHKKAEQIINKCIEIKSDSPEVWVALAEHFHYYDVDLKKALSIIKIAIEKAVADGNFLRYALGVQARISLELEEYELFEKTLLRLIDFKPRQGSSDIDLEDDFIIRIPPGKVSESIINSYRLVLKRVRGNKTE